MGEFEVLGEVEIFEIEHFLFEVLIPVDGKRLFHTVVNGELEHEFRSIITRKRLDVLDRMDPGLEFLKFTKLKNSSERHKRVINLFGMRVVSVRELDLKVDDLIAIELNILIDQFRDSVFDLRVLFIILLQLVTVNQDVIHYADTCVHDVAVLFVQAFFYLLDWDAHCCS